MGYDNGIYIKRGDKKTVDPTNTSLGWGNYYQSAVYNSEGTEIIKPANNYTLLQTGITTFTMSNNIYDLAGNYKECTRESEGKILRGIYYSTYGDYHYASCRYVNHSLPSDGRYYTSTRAVLYLNI